MTSVSTETRAAQRDRIVNGAGFIAALDEDVQAGMADESNMFFAGMRYIINIIVKLL